MCSVLVSWIDLNMDTDSQSQVCDSTVVEHSLGLAIKHTFELIFRVTTAKRVFHQKTRDIMILFVVKNNKIRFWAVHITQNKLWPYWQYYKITSKAPTVSDSLIVNLTKSWTKKITYGRKSAPISPKINIFSIGQKICLADWFYFPKHPKLSPNS